MSTSRNAEPSYTISQAATLCGTSQDTIKRRLKRGSFPDARQLDDRTRTWQIPLNDLVAAGLYELTPGGAIDAEAAISRSRDGERVADLRQQIAAQAARIGELERRLEDRDHEIAWLRALVMGSGGAPTAVA